MSWEDNNRKKFKVPKIEIIVEDKETGEKIVIAQYEKTIIFPESYCQEMAEVIYEFLRKNTSKLAGKVQKDYRNFVFFEKLLNKKPFEVNYKKKKDRNFSSISSIKNVCIFFN